MKINMDNKIAQVLSLKDFNRLRSLLERCRYRAFSEVFNLYKKGSYDEMDVDSVDKLLNNLRLDALGIKLEIEKWRRYIEICCQKNTSSFETAFSEQPE